MANQFFHRQSILQATKQILWECIGSFLIAIGIYHFAVQAEFPMTGFSGISIILHRLVGIPIGVSTILLNIPVAILCCHLLGKRFFVSSVRCMIPSSLIIDYLAPLFPAYQGNRLLAALCTGIFGGLGYAVIDIPNSSTGGSDFIIMAVKAIKPHLSLGNIPFLSDAGIILAGGILFRDMDGVIYGMIGNYIFAIVVAQRTAPRRKSDRLRKPRNPFTSPLPSRRRQEIPPDPQIVPPGWCNGSFESRQRRNRR